MPEENFGTCMLNLPRAHIDASPSDAIIFALPVTPHP